MDASTESALSFNGSRYVPVALLQTRSDPRVLLVGANIARMTSIRSLTALALGSVLLVSVAACSSGTSSDSASASESASPSQSSDPSGLLGQWTADASEVLNANTSNLGGAGAVTCTGPIVLSFHEDDKFNQRGNVTCQVPGTSAQVSGGVDSRGKYSATDSTITFTDTKNLGGITVGGRRIVLSGWLGSSDSAANYRIAGETLTITFTEAAVGTVTQTYTRRTA